MVMEKYLNILEKAKQSNILIPVECRVCESKRLMHMYSFCWKYNLCNICANQRVNLFVDSEGRGQYYV